MGPRRIAPAVLPVRLLVLALVAAPAAHGQKAAPAQTKAPRALAEELQGSARVAFEQGRTLFEHGDYMTAHAKFREAHELSGDVRLVWNMAACSSKLRRYARAIAEAERYLAQGQAVLTAEQQERARAFLVEMRAFVAEATFVVAPEGASLAIDGEPAPVAQGRFTRLLEVGVHEVFAELAGHEPQRERVSVEGPAAFTRQLTLAPIVRLARLVVDAPDDARVFVDDRPEVRGRFEGELPAGTHRVRVEASGREPYAAVVDLAAGASKAMTVTLSPVASGPWWPWALGGAAFACGAALGGYFLLKPDPVQESQLPGTLGTVYLR
jgi:hypothetical protein